MAKSSGSRASGARKVNFNAGGKHVSFKTAPRASSTTRHVTPKTPPVHFKTKDGKSVKFVPKTTSPTPRRRTSTATPRRTSPNSTRRRTPRQTSPNSTRRTTPRKTAPATPRKRPGEISGGDIKPRRSSRRSRAAPQVIEPDEHQFPSMAGQPRRVAEVKPIVVPGKDVDFTTKDGKTVTFKIKPREIPQPQPKQPRTEPSLTTSEGRQIGSEAMASIDRGRRTTTTIGNKETQERVTINENNRGDIESDDETLGVSDFPMRQKKSRERQPKLDMVGITEDQLDDEMDEIFSQVRKVIKK